MLQTRAPAVAGLFYPDDPATLRRQVQSMLALAQPGDPAPKALIVPHAGYVYSGPVAASAYAALAGAAARIRRVVLLGPSHRVAFRGLALCSAKAYTTPLGRIELDLELQQRARAVEGVRELDAAHESEHSLEVQLPFLQAMLGEFSLLPVVVGQTRADQVADLLETVWGGAETLIVISTDLSHYLSYDAARRIDAQTTAAIEAADADAIGPEQACGYHPLTGLLRLAHRRGMEIKTLDLRNSGDTAGTRNQVVGYGSYALYESH